MDDPECYDKASKYWAEIPATVDGMLGGLSKVSTSDINFSSRCFEQLRSKGFITQSQLVVDVGAGIGRISKHFLSKHFDQVDLLEADEHFLAAAPNYLGPTVLKQIRKTIPLRLQDFHPEPETYDCVWIQWVSSHLRDEDFVEALRRLKASLRAASNGLIFVKENLTQPHQGDEFDSLDASVTRTRERFLELFEQAELTLIRESKQDRFPTELYEVRLFALQ
ncbi:putative N-terminal Xaa-Pro-Lys N-methyltransferase 1 [Hypsibius exemplaris]|uniref:Alpha N-terminal protein methyltransferase 1 n=1 Tax=Hypsibius exemplaris TaxID=2072580 RepID=A0A1W0W9M6_HYPEX|nr:putative N-terminal Xaa-Pro-Lys N-methyltransferase 1 [Hypsibius exemplaris]